MAIYVILLILITIILALNYKKTISNRLALILCMLLMVAVVGLRSVSVGEDTNAYLKLYQLSSEISYKDIFSSFPYLKIYKYDYSYSYGYLEKIETVFLLYSKVLMSVFKNEYALQFISSLLTFVLFGKFIKDNTDDFRLPIFVVLCEYVFFGSFNGVRQLFSIAIALQSIRYLRERKSIAKPILIVAFASLFHVSTLFFFFLFPIFLIRDGKKSFIFSVTVALSAALLLVPFIDTLSNFLPLFDKYDYYIGKSLWGFKLGGTALMWLFVIVLFVVNFIKKDTIQKQDYVFFGIYVLYLTFELLAISQTIFNRLVSDLRVFNIIIIPYLVKKVSKSTNVGLFYKAILLILLLGQFYSYASLESRDFVFFFN